MKPRILILDDDPVFVQFITVACAAHASSVHHVTHPAALMAKLADGADVVLLDLRMPELDGIDLLREFASDSDTFPPIVLISGLEANIRDTSAELARKLGFRVLAVLPKPVSLHDVDELFRSFERDRRTPVLPTRTYSEETCRQALFQNQLFVVYQPQVRLTDGTLLGVEALVRWQHPEHGEVSPSCFVDVLERAGEGHALLSFVLERALAEMGPVSARYPDVTLSVNMNADVLRDSRLADSVLEVLRRHGVPPQMLCLEVTEAALVLEDIATLQGLVRLRMSGVRFSIDDFGTGHSTLAQLRRLPVSEIKLDQSYVQTLGDSEPSRAIVEGLLRIATGLGATVVAEGVEKESTAKVLREVGCETAQGYFFAPPMSMGMLGKWLDQRARKRN